MCLTPAGTAYTQAHAVHAPAACALLHAARVQCVRVKKNKKLAGVLPSFPARRTTTT